MKNTVKLSDIGARTMHVVRFVRRFFPNAIGFYCDERIFAGSTTCSARNKAIQGKVCRRGPQKVNLKVVTWRRTAIAIFARERERTHAHTRIRNTSV